MPATSLLSNHGLIPNFACWSLDVLTIAGAAVYHQTRTYPHDSQM